MTVDEISRELAALVAVFSLAMIAIAIGLLRQFWTRFERLRLNLSPSQWAATYRMALTILICAIVVLLLYISLRIQNPDYVLPRWLLPVGFFGAPILILAIDIVVRSKVKKQPVADADANTYYYLTALSLMSFSVLFNIAAVIGVTPSMLLIKWGPLEAESFEWSKWILIIAIMFFFGGILLFATAFILEKTREWKKRLPKDNPN